MLALEEAGVARLIPGLVCDLPAIPRIIPAGSCVDELISVVLVVLIPATDDDRISSIGRCTADASDCGAVNARLRHLLSACPSAAHGEAGELTEVPIRHSDRLSQGRSGLVSQGTDSIE